MLPNTCSQTCVHLLAYLKVGEVCCLLEAGRTQLARTSWQSTALTRSSLDILLPRSASQSAQPGDHSRL